MDQVTEVVVRFYWPLVRVAGVLSVAPVIGSPQIPKRIRVAIAVVLTLSMYSLTGPVPDVDPVSISGVIVTINQFIIGLVMGFSLLIVFNILTVAGESISSAMGLGFALMSDPSSGVQVPIVSQFYSILATLLFLALDGHHALISMMANSFIIIPVSTSLSPDGFWQLVEWSSVLFAGAIMLALPALVTMLVINVIMGVMTRAAPQLNIFSIGFPITMTLGFIVILITLPGFAPGFEKLLHDGFEGTARFLKGLSP
ncbi:MAG: flagellar biosynthetic protein FliR [Granulosicoccus sp.]|nr:flagellar biosynthetic protein FliR [Granulosicoccus sp.]